MIEIQIRAAELTAAEQQVVGDGFTRHTSAHSAPPYHKQRVSWLAYDDSRQLVGALAADIVWDWMYVDELWVDERVRGEGLGKRLLQQAEAYAASKTLTGVWLWTQSWQAAEFYKHLGYQEFAQFPDFPKGHSRIGFRKQL